MHERMRRAIYPRIAHALLKSDQAIRRLFGKLFLEGIQRTAIGRNRLKLPVIQLRFVVHVISSLYPPPSATIRLARAQFAELFTQPVDVRLQRMGVHVGLESPYLFEQRIFGYQAARIGKTLKQLRFPYR